MSESSSEKIKVITLSKDADLADAFAVRKAVFHLEQGIDEAEDFDGKDNSANQFVAYIGQEPIGTARVIYLDDGTAKVQRVAILKEYRGKDYGLQIMQHIIKYLQTNNVSKVVLES